jgi:DNA-binding beta-propeller fold protein YncE
MIAKASLALAIGTLVVQPLAAKTQTRCEGAPQFSVDAFWPRPLPNQWLLGQVSGVAVDDRDQVWVLHRPATLTDEERAAEANPAQAGCCIPAPPLMAFDPKGNVIAAWGGERRGDRWPHREHSIAVDNRDGSLWIAGNDDKDGFVVKYDRDGKFLMRIGASGPSKGSNDVTQLGRPSGLVVDAASNELFIADGYANHRIIVFDATTGEYKRHWGAYGRQPVDGTPANPNDQLVQPHGISLSGDGLLYVSDRPNNRIQVFQKDGRLVAEHVHKTDLPRTAWDAVAWPLANPTHVLAADGTNNEIRILDRSSGNPIGRFGRTGPYAGEFRVLHNIAVDREGRIYTAELGQGKRVQRFHPVKSARQPGRGNRC